MARAKTWRTNSEKLYMSKKVFIHNCIVISTLAVVFETGTLGTITPRMGGNICLGLKKLSA